MSANAKEFYGNWTDSENHPLGLIKQSRRLAVIKSFLKRSDFPNLLIVGCGFQTDIFISADEQHPTNKRTIIAFDLSYKRVSLARTQYKTNKYLVADAQHLPFKRNAFSCIICSEVLEHLTDPRAAILDFHQVLCDNGRLIITTPNWVSWYGLARKVAELLLKKPVTSAGQPIDNWYTYNSLKKLLIDKFKIKSKRGIWYFPPTGRGMKVIPSQITVPLYRLFQPVERLLEITLPHCGHMLAWRCIKRQENG